MKPVSLKKRRRPFRRGLIPSNLFNDNHFFDEPLWMKRLDEPALNIKETDDTFEIELAAPGYSKKDFNVTIDGGLLNISAEKESEEKEEEENYTCREFSYESFQRSLMLPETVKSEDVKAKYENGILKFHLAKKEEAKKPKIVEVS
ncbi:Hsp20/alpha crystallin family protein [Aureibaculum marinum]|uniref:Hsp20/alpha crystallin family protein n=1 Tax=Aureibaculum marinum TaxID=2487930 RepID=A0A3N4NWV0_9FLAO|nr:Hsp20/alpha crystallin family protein [Aureibaculum marinum]RPD98738.1 Hsp20/alpha crystallin family protein [Aureibaculum marinum]